jgi:hypothetical protein
MKYKTLIYKRSKNNEGNIRQHILTGNFTIFEIHNLLKQGLELNIIPEVKESPVKNP